MSTHWLHTAWRTFFLAALLSLSAGVRADAPPQAGSPAPAFTLPDATGAKRTLSDWKGKWLVLYFYPKDKTPGCTTEAINFRDNLPRLTALNAAVAGVSVDNGASHQAFTEELRLPFPLLSDTDGQVSRRFGAYSDFGVLKFAKRHTFIIDPEGRIAKVYLQVDAAKHAQEVLADLKTLSGK